MKPAFSARRTSYSHAAKPLISVDSASTTVQSVAVLNVANGAIIGEMDVRTQATIEAAKGALIKALNRSTGKRSRNQPQR